MIFRRDRWTPERLREFLRDTDQRLDQTRQFAQDIRVDLDLAREEIIALRDRATALEAQQNRAAVVTALPVNAPLGALIRLQGDLTGALYLGNGPTRALTKLLPTVL